MTSIVTTLVEGDYIKGVGTLANSLYFHGFRGTIYAGYRGTLANWAEKAESCGSHRELKIFEDLKVVFLPVPSDWHMANLKPHFMLEVIREWEPHADAFFYFDPDIVVKCRWTFFLQWVTFGVALCEESVMHSMGSNHPLRRGWSRWAFEHGWEVRRCVPSPLNSGFIGIHRSQFDALVLWRDVLNAVGEEVSMKAFTPGDRTDLFNMVDQDALNVFSMIYEGEISQVGPEQMDFRPAGFIMSHATGGAKPWRKKFVKSALGGIPPSLADKQWFRYTNGPIQILSPLRRQMTAISIRIAAGIGRFYRRW